MLQKYYFFLSDYSCIKVPQRLICRRGFKMVDKRGNQNSSDCVDCTQPQTKLNYINNEYNLPLSVGAEMNAEPTL
jgi:hypothetical protein